MTDNTQNDQVWEVLRASAADSFRAELAKDKAAENI